MSQTLTFKDDGTFILHKDGRYTYKKGSYATKGKIKIEGEQVYMSDNYSSDEDIWAPINSDHAEQMKKFLRGQHGA